MKRELCIIVPVLNEAASLPAHLSHLQAFRQRGAHLVVVDGGSDDDTLNIARAHADVAFVAPRGRAAQMNAGAAACPARTLLFLHADTHLPDDADEVIDRALGTKRGWGRFDVLLESDRPILRTVAGMMNLRSRLTGIATGDQALFVRHEWFRAVGGFPNIPLMEDVAMSKQLLSLGRPACLREKVTTSARRWEQHGVWRTIFLMWRLRAAYFLGADPKRLATQYGLRPHESQS